MKLKKIYRIEHPIDGLGIYFSKYSDHIDEEIYETLKHFHNKLPTPREENLKLSSTLFCAFTTKAKLRKWIKYSWCEELLDKGFLIHEIQIYDYNLQIGLNQSLYDKTHIISKKTLDISEIY